MSQELFVKMTLSAWKAQNKTLDEFLDKLTDEQLMKETARGETPASTCLAT